MQSYRKQPATMVAAHILSPGLRGVRLFTFHIIIILHLIILYWVLLKIEWSSPQMPCTNILDGRRRYNGKVTADISSSSWNEFQFTNANLEEISFKSCPTPGTENGTNVIFLVRDIPNHQATNHYWAVDNSVSNRTEKDILILLVSSHCFYIVSAYNIYVLCM